MFKLHAAVVGVGFVGRAHLEALRRLGIRVEGILGSSPERGAEAAAALGVERAYSSLDELASDRAVDVVHVCTPNHVHAGQTTALMRAEKHVMCEKPLAMDSRESAALVQLAHKTGLAGGVTYNLRYYPLCQQARLLIAQGAIGEPRMVHGSFLQDWLQYPADWNWRLEPHLGGQLRAVSDIGTHWLDMAMFLTGRKVTEVCADLATFMPVRRRPRGRVESFQKSGSGEFDEVAIHTDDYASILLRFEGNLRGVMTVSQVSPGRKTRLWFEVDGSEGSLAWNSEDPNLLWIGSRHQANRSIVKDPALMSPEVRGYAAYPGGHAEGYPDTFVQLFKDFYGYIQDGDFARPRTFPTFATGHEEMLLCDLIAKSSQEHRWVKAGEP